MLYMNFLVLYEDEEGNEAHVDVYSEEAAEEVKRDLEDSNFQNIRIEKARD